MTDFNYKQHPISTQYEAGWDRVFDKRSNFDKAADFTLSPTVEGGFTLDPDDRGNWTSGKIGEGELRGTKYGISAAAFPQLDIKNITIEDARAIYKKMYWDACDCDNVSWPLAACVFDTAVNSGVSRAKKLLKDCDSWVEYLERRKKFVLSLNKEKYINGWLARIAKLKGACEKWVM